MPRWFYLLAVAGVALLAGVFFASVAGAQEAPGLDQNEPAANQAVPVPDAPRKFRKLAPGIENTIEPDTQKEEFFSRHDLVHLLERDPKFGERPWSANLARGVRMDHKIWGLEFTFKPFGMIWVDVPNGAGELERKLVWYLVYHVRNPGAEPVKFTPRVVLHAEDGNKYYEERLAPVAVPLIQKREDPQRKLLNSVEIGQVEIPPAEEAAAAGEEADVWGVFTWTDIDPSTDFFSVYIQGLTNAYRREAVQDDEGKPAWQFYRKTLQINFWRPGDEFFEKEEEIRLSAPNKVEYEWVYR